MAQGSQMRQTYDAASPNCPSTAGIAYTDEPLQVRHKVVRECVQIVNQLKARFLSTVRVLYL